MTLAIVFPGQGSQSVGMMKGLANERAVESTFREASLIADVDYWSMVNEGPPEALNQTVNTQPLMLVAGVACWRAWREKGGPMPAWFAGHSLGEYTALTAAGALSFEDAVPLVRFRAQAMQNAVPVGTGSMAAILGLADELVRQACSEAAQGEVVEAVNFNAPAQVVIAGHKAAVERACEAARRLGAKRAMPLSVSAPFHSSLLAPARERLRERLATVEIARPAAAVVNNVDVAIEHDPARIREALARQAAGPVRWSETMVRIAADVTHVIECGPGKVLAGLVKRAAPGVESLAITDPAGLQDALARVRG
jgi:[acyl-carrier-protein] S-malonyltransferase